MGFIVIVCLFRDIGHSVFEVGVGRPAGVARRGLLYHPVGLCTDGACAAHVVGWGFLCLQ